MRPIEVHLELDRRDISDRLQESLIVVPVHPLEGGKLYVLETAPRPAPTNRLGHVETHDGLGQGIVIGIASAADRRFDADFGEPLGVTDRDVLTGFKESSQHVLVGEKVARR